LIEDPFHKARRFKNDLQLELKNPLVTFDLKDYNELYGWAQLIRGTWTNEPPHLSRGSSPIEMVISLGRNRCLKEDIPLCPTKRMGLESQRPTPMACGVSIGKNMV